MRKTKSHDQIPFDTMCKLKRKYESIRGVSFNAPSRSIVSPDSHSQVSYQLNALQIELNRQRFQTHLDSDDAAWERNFPLCAAEKNADAVGYGIMFREAR